MGYISTLLKLLGAGGTPHRILDVGCGFGPALQLLSRVSGVRALGYETSGVRVEDLQARGLSATADFQTVAAEGPFAAILDNVLEHVPHPRDTLAQIRNLTKPGTLVFVSVPDVTRGRLQAQRQAPRSNASIPMDINPWEHLNYFDLAHLDDVFDQFGFAPLNTSAVPHPVDIGLRPLASRWQRLKNGLASLPRLASYVVGGDAMQSVTGRFYRRTD